MSGPCPGPFLELEREPRLRLRDLRAAPRAADEALVAVDRVSRVDDAARLRGAADEDLAVRVEADDAREQARAVLVGEHVDLPRTDAGNDRVGRAEIDPDDAHQQRSITIRHPPEKAFVSAPWGARVRSGASMTDRGEGTADDRRRPRWAAGSRCRAAATTSGPRPGRSRSASRPRPSRTSWSSSSTSRSPTCCRETSSTGAAGSPSPSSSSLHTTASSC